MRNIRSVVAISIVAALAVTGPAANSVSAGAAGSPIPPLANPGLLRSLTSTQRAALARNGFVVQPPTRPGDVAGQQFYGVYTTNYQSGIPSFITSDALLHTFHIMYDKTLVALERELLAPKLQRLSDGLMNVAVYQYGATKDARLKQAARLNLGFVSVADRLLSPHAVVPALVRSQVNAELALVRAHRGFARSPLFGYEVDYSQFVPRGHYNESETLRRYFLAMTWYAQIAFPLSGPNKLLNTQQALLLTRGVTLVSQLHSLWSAIFDPVTAWVGQSDDLTVRDYAAVMARVYPAHAPVSALSDNSRLARFITLANALPAPRIRGALGAVRSMRLFPQRFIPDAAIMQALIWNKVGTQQNPRVWPMGLDVAAALGSQRAQSLLTGPLHQNRYAHYTQQLASQRRLYAVLPNSAWHQNLYYGWLHTLQAVLAPSPAGAPAFMRNTAWADKSLATGLGSWAELRHDTLLYAKQVYGLGAGGPPPPYRMPYVEPVPLVYARLLELIHSFKNTLAGEGLLDHLQQPIDRIPAQSAQSFLVPPPPRGDAGYRAAIDSFAALVALAQRVASVELHGGTPSNADAVTLAKVGQELAVVDDFFQDNAASKALRPEQKQVSVIADIFTEPASRQVLEEGVGNVLPLYVVVSINGRRWLTKGAVYSYYEFHWPMSNRLTDAAWQQMAHRPPLPAWTAAYIMR